MKDYTIPLHETNPWEEEPELKVYGDNTSALSSPVPYNRYWNDMSPELEFCQYVQDQLAQLTTETFQGLFVLETGVGQGFVTRRILEVLRRQDAYRGYDTDPHFLYMIPEDRYGEASQFLPGPADSGDIIRADLVVLDSDMPEPRIPELKTWLDHGRPGSHLIIHDAPGGEGRPNDLAKIIRRSEIEGKWLDNYRGGWHGVHP